MLDMLSHLMDILAPTLRPVSRSQSEPVSGLLLHTAPFLRSGLLCYILLLYSFVSPVSFEDSDVL